MLYRVLIIKRTTMKAYKNTEKTSNFNTQFDNTASTSDGTLNSITRDYID